MLKQTAPAAPGRRGTVFPPSWALAIIPALLVLAFYWPALRFEFVWDDERLVTNNPLLRSWAGLGWALRSDFWLTVGVHSSGFWRPLITLSYAVDGVLFRWQPWGFHLMNLIAAAGVASLVTLLGLRLGAGRWAALLAGSWFALMPHHVESTAWVAGRTDLYAALFFLLALWFDRRQADSGARGTSKRALITFAAALLCKEAAVLFVVVSFAWQWCDLGLERRPFRAALRWTVPYIVITAVYLALHLLWVPPAPPPNYLSPEVLRGGVRSSWLMFTGYMAFLSPFFTHTPAVVVRLPNTWRDAELLFAIVLQAGVLGALGWTFWRRSRWSLAWLVLWVTLLPTTLANLFQSYLLYSERFMYMPSIGAAWLLALILAAVGRRSVFERVALWALSLALVGSAGWATAHVIPDWRNDETLYRSMTEKQPRNAMGWILLARHRLVLNDETAAEHAIAMLEGLESTRPELISIKALLQYRRGNWEKVIELATHSIELDPSLSEPRLARTAALLRLGRLDEAERAITELQILLPQNPTVASLEGQRLLALRRPGDALPFLRSAVEYLHDDSDLYYALGLSHAMLNQIAPARAAFEECIRVDPTLYDGWLRLATACHVMGDAGARDEALRRAAALPESADGRLEQLRARMAAIPR